MRKSIKKSIILSFVVLFVLSFSIPIYAGAAANANTTSKSPLLDDKAHLLTDAEATQILEQLQQDSDKSECNIVVITTNENLTEQALATYADNYYNNTVANASNYTFAIILSLDISSRKVDVGTYNPGSKRNLNDNAKTELREDITSDLTNGNYAKAFSKYSTEASKMAASINEDGSRNKSSFPWLTRIIISLVIGVILSIIICMIIKKQLKTVEMKAGAADYIRPNSLNITQSRDQYLYSNVTKTPKPKSNSSGGGYGGGSSGSHSSGSF